MSRCEHIALLQVTSKKELALHDIGRFSRVAQELTNPKEQCPRLVHLVGSKARDVAIRELFPHNNTKKTRGHGLANFRADVASFNSETPLLFADSDPFAEIPASHSLERCHDVTTYPTTWSRSTRHSPLDILHARLLFLFTDVICIFADDFPNLVDVAGRLVNWMVIGSGSILPTRIRPRVLIVTSDSDPSIVIQAKDFEQCFSSIDLFPLAGDGLSPSARYRPLKEAIRAHTRSLQDLRRQHGFLFSADHLAVFFQYAVQHTASTILRPFDFVRESRRGNEVGEDYREHVANFLSLCKKFRLPYDSIASYIASTILMDAYPPGMHRESLVPLPSQACLTPTAGFPPGVVFRSLYKTHCLKAFSEVFDSPSVSIAEHQCHRIENHLDALMPGLELGYDSSAQLHSDNIASLSLQLAQMKLNRTCLYCLRRKPEHPLGCGHSKCDTCVKIFGHGLTGVECQYAVKLCILCQSRGRLVVRLKDANAGLNVLTIDGGGPRGVVPLQFLTLLQEILVDCPLHDLIHVAAGTSSGKYVVKQSPLFLLLSVPL